MLHWGFDFKSFEILKYQGAEELFFLKKNSEKEQHTWKVFMIYAYASKVWIDINLLLDRRLFILREFKLETFSQDSVRNVLVVRLMQLYWLKA